VNCYIYTYTATESLPIKKEHPIIRPSTVERAISRNNMSQEKEILANMVSVRDAQIAQLTHQLHSTSDALQVAHKDLQAKSNSRKQQREEHSNTIKKLKEEHTDQRRTLAKFEKSIKSGGGLRVHEYAQLMKEANDKQVESSYVIRLQAQLCRAMHSLGVMESQLALVKENCSSLIKFMKEDLSHMVDDRTRREIELMNGLARVDSEKRVMAEEMEQKIQEKEELLESVRDEYEELGLDYDENEVKRALEVKYLLEQMQKVEEDKVRLEKELLAALLERDQQIVQLRKETDDLGKKLDSLELESLEAEGKVNEDAGGGNPSAEEADRDGGENAVADNAEKDITNIATQVEATKLDGPDDDSRAEDGSNDEPTAPEGPADDSAENDTQQDEVNETRSQVETSISGESLSSKEGIKEPLTSVTESEESAGQTSVEGDAVVVEEEESEGSSTEPATDSDVPTSDNNQGQG